MGGVTESCKFIGNGATNCGRGKFFRASSSVFSQCFFCPGRTIHSLIQNCKIQVPEVCLEAKGSFRHLSSSLLAHQGRARQSSFSLCFSKDVGLVQFHSVPGLGPSAKKST